MARYIEWYGRLVFRRVKNMVKRGDIYFADLSPVVGSEQGGMRPVLIVQNDTTSTSPAPAWA